jgi:hypothetical protein
MITVFASGGASGLALSRPEPDQPEDPPSAQPRRHRGKDSGGNLQARIAAHPAAQLCYASPRTGRRHPRDPGVVDPDLTWGWRSRRARAFEGLDDDHPAAATRAAARRRNVFSLTSGLGARTLGGGLARGEPLPRRRALTLRAVTVAAGIVGDAFVRTVLAALDVSAERRGPTGLDRRHHLQLGKAHVTGVSLAPRRAMGATTTEAQSTFGNTVSTVAASRSRATRMVCCRRRDRDDRACRRSCARLAGSSERGP